MMKRNERGLFYRNEDPMQAKDSFIAVSDKITDGFDGKLLDIGCANGAFLYYLSTMYPDSDLHGMEYLHELVEASKFDNKNINIRQDDIRRLAKHWGEFDIVTMLGVLGIFDDFEIVLKHTLELVAAGGKLILHGMFNEYDLDVQIKYAYSSEPRIFNSGWNIISLASIDRIVSCNGAKLTKVDSFNIKTAIAKRADPVRSWTENDGERKQIYNGLHIRQPQKILTISKF